MDKHEKIYIVMKTFKGKCLGKQFGHFWFFNDEP
jgi:hypothetical protein